MAWYQGVPDLGRAVPVDPMKPTLKPWSVVLEPKMRCSAFKICCQFQLAPLHLGLRVFCIAWRRRDENPLIRVQGGVNSRLAHVTVFPRGTLAADDEVISDHALRAGAY
jgi:hypothetical protein